ncbi:MAG: 2-oxoglutarate dehydrogenase subunit E1, partial [Parachlamydiaceae bacterium]|nr:2-oxoglutarate dehydrogenase subunit E1 [Parachlamydiaceae bacterium]
HLLRRQVLQKLKKPLIVFTPKGLLRHPLCLSPLKDFENGAFLTLIDDPNQSKNPRRLVFCSGRIYYDLETVRKKEGIQDIVLVRIEQLYPLDTLRIKEIIQKYGSFKECLWVQEEPKNMGAWNYISHPLQDLLPENMRLIYVGREQSATPATGFLTKHKKEHAQIMQQVFKI